jgi:hypothetical protein
MKEGSTSWNRDRRAPDKSREVFAACAGQPVYVYAPGCCTYSYFAACCDDGTEAEQHHRNLSYATSAQDDTRERFTNWASTSLMLGPIRALLQPQARSAPAVQFEWDSSHDLHLILARALTPASFSATPTPARTSTTPACAPHRQFLPFLPSL